jgi:hypothetical protein
MHIIEEIVDAVLSPFVTTSSKIGELIGLIIAFFATLFGLLLLPIRISMLASDFQDQLNSISMLIDVVQWLSNGISGVTQDYSTISSVIASTLDLTIYGVTVGNILSSVLGLLVVWLFFSFLPEITS